MKHVLERTNLTEVFFSMLRTIVQPCEWMVNNRTGELGLFEKAEWVTDSNGEDVYGIIVLNNIDWNGSYIGYGSSTVTIPHFGGTESITGLSCYPLRYAADIDKIRSEAIDNGKKFMSLAGVYHKSYTHSSVEQSVSRSKTNMHGNSAWFSRGSLTNTCSVRIELSSMQRLIMPRPTVVTTDQEDYPADHL